VAGALVAPQVFVSADMGFSPLLLALTGAVLGGFGSFLGAVVGGYCVAFVGTTASVLGSSEWQGTFAFVLLLLVLMLRPDGLFGRAAPGRV
jgi:branched-chain amino acid transport system permease protein